MLREYPDWIDEFVQSTSTTNSPEIFRRWAAITCIAGALERKVWAVSQRRPVYPNIYTILVAPPGIGKSQISSVVEKMWRSLPDHHVAPTSMSRAAMADALNNAERIIQRPRETPATVKFNSLKILSNELGTLLPSYDTEFMANLTDIYDGSPYDESKRSLKEPILIQHPQLNMLAGTTPSHLNSFLPAGAWDQGFLSRAFLVYSGLKIRSKLFGHSEEVEEYPELLADLKQMAALYGSVEWSREAIEAIEAWHLGGNLPEPDHPKLKNYNTRRTIHALKLSIIFSVSRSNSLKVELEDYQRAMDALHEMEEYIPDIFKAMNTGGDSQAIEDCWHFVMKLGVKAKGQPIPEQYVIQFLAERVPAHNIENILGIMVRQRLLKQVQVNKVGPCYKALDKHSLY